MKDTRTSRYDAVMAVPFGMLGIRVNGEGLCGIDFLGPQADERAPRDPLSAQVVAQVYHYLKDPAWSFTLPVDMQGTAFQQRVWARLRRVPSGDTRSYAELAGELGSAARAVGNACRHNPVPIVVPCHRVVARTGVGGYCGAREGYSVSVKRWLLDHEREGAGGG